jgi:hypothetical protein
LPDDVFKTQPKDNEEQVLFKVIGTFIGEGQQVDALSSYTPAKKNGDSVVVLVVVVVDTAVVVLVVVVVVTLAAWHSSQVSYIVDGTFAIGSPIDVSVMSQHFPS